MSANPFTLSFGKKPLQYISRLTETNQILESFCAEIPSNQIYMITGVRGSGKTVMMTNIASEFVTSSTLISNLFSLFWIYFNMSSRAFSISVTGAAFSMDTPRPKAEKSSFALMNSVCNSGML